MGLWEQISWTKEKEAEKKKSKSLYKKVKKGKVEFEPAAVNILYIAIVKQNKRWFPMGKIEHGKWWDILQTSGDFRKGIIFRGFEKKEEAKKVALQYSKILELPFKEIK